MQGKGQVRFSVTPISSIAIGSAEAECMSLAGGGASGGAEELVAAVAEGMEAGFMPEMTDEVWSDPRVVTFYHSPHPTKSPGASMC